MEVDGRPIRSAEDADALIRQLRRTQEFYRTGARYRAAADRLQMLALFDRAADALRERKARP